MTNREAIMAEVDRRNVHTLDDADKQLGKRIDDMEALVRGYESTLMSLLAKVNSMEKQVILLTLGGATRGPTA